MRIVIVGVCGSGKSILAAGLAELGYEAHPVAQEHSLVPDLFLHSQPGLVIYLEASDETVARRKETGWKPGQLRAQRERLKLAKARADIHLRTDGLRPDELVARAVDKLAKYF